MIKKLKSGLQHDPKVAVPLSLEHLALLVMKQLLLQLLLSYWV